MSLTSTSPVISGRLSDFIIRASLEKLPGNAEFLLGLDRTMSNLNSEVHSFGPSYYLSDGTSLHLYIEHDNDEVKVSLHRRNRSDKIIPFSDIEAANLLRYPVVLFNQATGKVSSPEIFLVGDSDRYPDFKIIKFRFDKCTEDYTYPGLFQCAGKQGYRLTVVGK